MKVKIIITSFLFTVICLTSTHAQENKTKYFFFDSNWKITTSKNYTYYRKVEVNSKGNFVNPIVDYYGNGEVQCIIKADYFNLQSGRTFLEAGGKNGEIAYFDTSGKMTSYQRYVNGKLIENQQLQKQKKSSEWTTADIVDGLELALTAYQVYRFFKGK